MCSCVLCACHGCAIQSEFPSFTQLLVVCNSTIIAHFLSSLPCSTADSANSIVCDVSGKGCKEEEENTDNEEEFTSCECTGEKEAGV